MLKPLSEPKVNGDPDAVDSFAACLCAVLEDFDQPAEYSFIEALTGTCFAACHNLGEDCVGWMVDGGNAARAEWMAGSLGLSIQAIRLGADAPKGKDWIKTYAETGIAPPEVQVYFKHIFQALEAGSAVILGTWPAWSVLTGRNDNLAMLPFSTTPGFEEVVSSSFPPACSRVAFAIHPAAHSFSREETLSAVLHYGAQIAAGKVSPCLPGYDSENRYGSAMYEKMAALAHEPFLCPACHENRCFHRAVKRINNGLQTAVTFLKSDREWINNGYTELALENLIEEYGHMELTTHKYLDQDFSGEHANQPEFRAALGRDFSELRMMQVQAAEHFEALVTGLNN